MELPLFIAIFGAALVLVLASIYRRRSRLRALRAEGVSIQGVVTSKHNFIQKNRPRFMLFYEYSPDGQKPCRGQCVVSQEQYNQFTEGQPLLLRYLPGDISVSAPQFVLDRA